MKFIQTKIPDVMLVKPVIYSDERGFFLETFQKIKFAEAGITHDFVQDNFSCSRKGTLRGLHYQIRNSQGKLLKVVSGEIFDVAVDLRRKTPYFGKWVSTILSAENMVQMWIPPGFAHGFYVLSERAELLYKATDYYAPEWERTILWSDSAIAIHWPLIDGYPLIISDKDKRGMLLREALVKDVFD